MDDQDIESRGSPSTPDDDVGEQKSGFQILVVLLILGSAVLFAVYGVYAQMEVIATNSTGKDFYGEFFHARALIESGASVYDHDAMLDLARQETGIGAIAPNVYPPLYSFLFAPIALLPLRQAQVVWLALNQLFLLGSIVGFWQIWKARTGVILPLAFPVIFYLLAGSIYHPTMEHLWYGQSNLPILFLVTWAIYLVVKPRPIIVWSALLFAIAIGLKVFPAIFLPYFIVRKKFWLVLTVVAFIVGLVLISLTVVDPKDYFRFPEVLASSMYVTGATRYGASYSASSWLGGVMHGLNASVSATRIVLILITTLPYLWFLIVSARERQPDAEAQGAMKIRELLRLSEGFILIGFIMAQFWGHHLVMLLFPYFMVLAALVTGLRKYRLPIVSVTALSLLIVGLLSNNGIYVSRWFSTDTISSTIGVPLVLFSSFKFTGIVLLLFAVELAISGLKMQERTSASPPLKGIGYARSQDDYA